MIGCLNPVVLPSQGCQALFLSNKRNRNWREAILLNTNLQWRNERCPTRRSSSCAFTGQGQLTERNRRLGSSCIGWNPYRI